MGEHFNPNNSKHGGPNDPPSQRVRITAFINGNHQLNLLELINWNLIYKHVGDLGNITADENGRATFRLMDTLLKVHDIIGRALVVTERADDLGRGETSDSKIHGNSGKRYVFYIMKKYLGINKKL